MKVACPTPDKAAFDSEYDALIAPKHPSVTPYRCKCGKWHHRTRRFANRKGKRR